MQEVLKQLQKELEEAQAMINYHEEIRDCTPHGSGAWRAQDSEAQIYRGEVFGLKKAIQAIERAGSKK